jgi:hypothetical protein
MAKFGIAKFSDLSGATNPSGIWSPAFLMLKQALDRGDTPDNVRQALYDWLGQRKVSADQVDALLELSPDEALAGLIQKIGGGLRAETLPQDVKDTLRRTLAKIAQTYADKEQQALASRQSRLDRIKSQFVEGQTPKQVVDKLLQ